MKSKHQKRTEALARAQSYTFEDSRVYRLAQDEQRLTDAELQCVRENWDEDHRLYILALEEAIDEARVYG